MDAPELPDEEVEGDLIDPEEVPLQETVWVARHLDFAFDGRLDTSQVLLRLVRRICGRAKGARVVVQAHDRG
jgi:hypothetical protein